MFSLPCRRGASQYAATEPVSADGQQAVLFAFLHSSSMLYPYPRIQLRGLEPEARYRLRAIAGELEEGSLEEASGAYWMSRGIDLRLAGDFQAAALVFVRVASAE